MSGVPAAHVPWHLADQSTLPISQSAFGIFLIMTIMFGHVSIGFPWFPSCPCKRSTPFHSIPFLHVGDVFLVFPTFRLAKGQSATRSAPLSRRAKALKWHLNFNTTLGDGMQGNTSLHFVTMCAVSHVLSTDNGGWTIHQTGRLSVFPFYSCNIEVFTAFHDSQVWGVAFKESKSEIGIQVWDPSLSCGEPTGNQASAFQNNT